MIDEVVLQLMGDFVLSIILLLILRHVMRRLAVHVAGERETIKALREQNRLLRDELFKIGEWQRQMIQNFMPGAMVAP